MVQIAYETKELGFWTVMAKWKEGLGGYVDSKGFLLNIDEALWIERV